MSAETAPVEFLYGIRAGEFDGNDHWKPAHVVRFRITKKTARRIYYAASEDWEARNRIRFVDRYRIETDGEIRPRSRHWFEPDCHLYLAEPVIEDHQRPDLAELKAAMAAAHPDRGGSDEQFITAREQYMRARANA